MRRRNKDRRWLLYTSGLLDKLVSFIISGRTTYTAATRHLSADVLSFALRRQDVVKVGTAYIKALYIPPETAQCPKCGPNPAFIVIDAQSLGCTDHTDTRPFRPTEDCPVLDIPASKLCILESAPLHEAVSKVLRTSTSLTAAQESLLRSWASTMLTPTRRLPASVAAARLFFRFFPLGASEPQATTKRGSGLPSAAGNASENTQASTGERATKRSRAASVNSSAENALRSDGDGGVVLGGKGPAAKKPTETWRDRTGVCRPDFGRYPRDDDGVWICVRPFLQSLLTETVPGMFTSFNERAIKLISNTMRIKGRGAWRVLTEALDGVGFVSSFVGLFAEDMDEDKGMRVAVGTLLRWAVDIEKFVDDAFSQVASSKTTLARGWVNGAYCDRWKGRPTPADYKRWRAEQTDLDELDEDDPLVSFEYFASLPRVRPGIRDSEAAKRRVQYRGKDRHVADLEGEGDACNKAFAIRSGLTQGVFNVVCPHVITLGFRVLFNAESVGEALSIVLERFPRLPKAIFYDVACKLDKNAMRRVRVIMRDHHVRCVLDRPHSITHGCSPTYMPDEFLGTTAGVATQAAEVSHSIAVVNRTSLAYMSPPTYMVHKMAQVAFMNLRKLYRLHSDTAAGENDHIALAPFFNGKVAQECQRAGTCSCGSPDGAVADDASGAEVIDAAAEAFSDAGGLGAHAPDGAAAVGEGLVDALSVREVPGDIVGDGGRAGDGPQGAEVIVVDGVDDDWSAGVSAAVVDTPASPMDAAIHPELLAKHASWVVDRVFYAPMATTPVSKTQKELVRQLVNAPLAAAVRPRNKARIVLSGADFLRLVGEAWLGSEVMNSIVALINDRDDRARRSRTLVGEGLAAASPAPTIPRTRVFNTYFVSRLAPRLLHYNYDAVRRWGVKAGLNLEDVDRIVVPVHAGNTHWVLVVIDVANRVFRFYDSLSTVDTHGVVGVLRRWLRDEIAARLGGDAATSWNVEAWKTDLDSSRPRQTDAGSCGVFVLAAADCFALGTPLLFSQKDVPTLRQRIALALFFDDLDCCLDVSCSDSLVAACAGVVDVPDDSDLEENASEPEIDDFSDSDGSGEPCVTTALGDAEELAAEAVGVHGVDGHALEVDVRSVECGDGGDGGGGNGAVDVGGGDWVGDGDGVGDMARVSLVEDMTWGGTANNDVK